MIDELGNRMKRHENVTRHILPRRTYTILRIDGRAFHTYTRGLKKPFDAKLTNDMADTALYLCQNIQGAKLGYVQSDEISILLTDFDEVETCAYFDGNIQKISSVVASMATAKFNQLRLMRSTFEQMKQYYEDEFTSFPPQAMFDCRTFSISQRVEVYNYFVYRNKDAIRNAISMIAQSLYSPKHLEGVNSINKIKLIEEKGVNYANYDETCKYGTVIKKDWVNKVISLKEIEHMKLPNGATNTRAIGEIKRVQTFIKTPAWNFSSIPETLIGEIPSYPEF